MLDIVTWRYIHYTKVSFQRGHENVFRTEFEFSLMPFPRVGGVALKFLCSMKQNLQYIVGENADSVR